MGKNNIISTVVGAVVTTAGLVVPGLQFLVPIGASMLISTGLNVMLGQPRLHEQQGAQLSNSVSQLAPLDVIYGQTMVGAPLADLRTQPGDRKDLWGVYAFALASEDGSGIEDVLGIQLDGKEMVPDPSIDTDLTDINVSAELRRDSAAHLHYAIRRGTDNQYAPTEFTNAIGAPAWPYLTSRGRGVAYAVLRFRYHADIYSSIPRVTFTVRGQRLWDPRTDTVAWSDNPALCILDYLMSARYGCGVPVGEIDTQSFEDAANYCDELINTTGYNGKRFTCNGRFSTAEDPDRVLAQLLTSCRGELVYQGGAFRLVIRQPTIAASVGITEDDIVGDIEIVRSGTAPNSVSVAYVDPEEDYQAREVQWPEPGQPNGFLTADNGIPSGITLQLPFTDSRYIAQQIGMVAVREAREDVTVTCAVKEGALRHAVGDVIPVTHSTPAWSGKPFWVVAIGIRQDALVQLLLREYDENAYTLDLQDTAATVPGSDLPDPFAVVEPPATLVLTSDATTALPTQDGQYVPRIRAAWAASPHAFLDYYELEYRPNDPLLAWQPAGRTRELEMFISPVTNGVEYEVRVRAVSTLGRASDWVPDTVTVSTQPGTGGTGINWLGEFAAHPADPDVNDAYRNTTDGVAYIYVGPGPDDWDVLARDGLPGTGTGLEIRYSGPAAGQNIASTFDPLVHAYMQMRRTDQAWPTTWARMVGEDGDAGADGIYYDYRFRVATTQPATPTGANPENWFDAPPAYDPATGNKLWMTRALKNAADDTLLGTWSTPVQVTGPQGPTGPVGPPGDTFGHPPTAHIVALAATDLTMDLRYSGTLGTDATGPLQWRRRIDREGGPEGLWGPGAGDGWVEASAANALPYTEAGILRDPRWDRIVVLEVRDANGQLASARFVIMPADIRRGGIRGYDAIEEPVPGGGYNIAPTIEDSGGREIRRFYGKPLPGDPDHIGSIQDGGGYRKPTINEATGGGRAYSALDSSNELVTGLKPIALVDGRSARDVRLLAEKPGHNLLVNPGFEAGDVGWGTGAGFSIINDPANARTGNFVVRYQSDGAGGPNFSPGLNIKLSPGERFRLGMWTRTPAGVGLMRLAMRFYDANGALLSTITIASAAPSVGWTYTSGIVTAPAGAVEGRFDIGENASDNTATPWYIDDVSVVRVVEANEAIRGSTTLDGILQNVTDAGHAGSGMQDSGGRAINRFFGKALTGTPDTLDGVPDGISFARTNHDEKVGADRAFDALDVSNRLTTGTTGSATDNGGRAINRFYGKPLFGDPDNFGSIADGGGYAKTTTNERTGAARGYAALDGSNRLATAVLGTATIDGETAARVRGQATSPSQNLLPREAGQEYTIGVEGTAGTDATLDAMGLAPGDVISISADLKVNDGVVRYIRLRVFRADSTAYLFGSGDQSTSAAYTRVKLENITIPADAVRLSVYIDNSGTTSSTFNVRRAMLNRGPVALPYEEPPFRPNREGAGDILRGSLRGDITAEQAGGTIVKSIPKGVVGGTCYNGVSVVFDEPYQNVPKIIFLVPAAIENRAKWGTRAQAQAGTASGAMPVNAFFRPRPLAADLDSGGFTPELIIEAKGAPVQRSAVFAGGSGITLGASSGNATPAAANVPAIDNTYRTRVRFDLTNNHLSQSWAGTVVAVLEVDTGSGPVEIATAAPAFMVPPGASESIEANLTGAISGIAGGDDNFRVTFKSITPGPGFTLQTVTIIQDLNWVQDTGAQYASMTPDGAADAIPYLVIAES